MPSCRREWCYICESEWGFECMKTHWGTEGLHVKMSENYFQILEVGKNVGKFLFRRSVKMSENDLVKVQKCRKMYQTDF